MIYDNYSRVAILYSDRDEKSQNGTDMLDGDRLVLKGAIHLQDLLLREDIDVHLRRLRLKAVVSYSSLHMSAMPLVLDNLQWLSPPPTTLAPINEKTCYVKSC